MSSDLLAKLKKAGTISAAKVLKDSIYYVSNEMIKTDFPILNIAFAGDVNLGFTSGITVIAGASKTFKSMLCLYIIASYMKKYEDSICIFYDSEFGIPDGYMKSMGIDTERVIHIPVTNIEELKQDIVNRLKAINRGDKVIIFTDSIGNLASIKEYKDAEAENEAKDMSRPGAIKSFFRIITPYIKMKDIPYIAIGHTYKEQKMYGKDIVSGGCLLAGTRVIMADGTLKDIQDIQIGDMVKTRYGNKEVIFTWNPDNLEEPEPECVRIVFSDGYKATCSKTHKFMGISGEWIEAGNLKDDDQLMMPDNEKIKVVDVMSVGKQPVYDIAVADAEHYFLENGICTHNSGMYYSADSIFIITKAQIKEKEEIAGFEYTIRIEKSRFAKEGTKLSFEVLYDKGLSKYSGLMELALESGDVIKPSNGWYQRVNVKTGEVDETKYRIKNTMSEEFWAPILQSENFQNYIRSKYKLGEEMYIPDAKSGDESSVFTDDIFSETEDD